MSKEPLNTSSYNITQSMDMEEQARVDIRFQLPVMAELQDESADYKIRRAFYECVKVEWSSMHSSIDIFL